MDLTSDDFEPDGTIPVRHARPEGNVPPTLRWSEVPPAAVELVLTCTDPDAPSGEFTHWLVAGIPADAAGLDPEEAGAVPVVAGRNDFGEDGYGGPEPPPGDDPHRYVFRLAALEAPSGLADGATMEEVRAVLDRGVLASAELVGRFGR